MTERPSESEPTLETAAWIDDEMRADSPIWETIARFGVDGEHPRFQTLALIMPPVGYDNSHNPLTKRQHFEFIRFDVAGNDGSEPTRKSAIECNRAWKEMILHHRVGFAPDRHSDVSPDILRHQTEPLRREAILFGLGLTFQLQFQPDCETSRSFDNAAAEFELTPVEQRGLARLTAHTRPLETLRMVLLHPEGKLAGHLTGRNGRPDLDCFGGPDVLERCKEEALVQLVNHGTGDPGELEWRLRELYPDLMDPESDSPGLRKQLNDTWWEKLMYLTAGKFNRSDDSIELAAPLHDRIDRSAVLERVRTFIENTIENPPSSPRHGPLDEVFLGPWQPTAEAAKALERFQKLFPETEAAA